MNKKIKILVVVLITCMLPAIAIAQFTDTKEIKKRFRVSTETQVEITNKYGKVKVYTWQKDSVYIKVKIRVEDKKLSKLEKAMSDIKIDFSNSPNFLIAKTRVGENQSGFEKEIQNLKETLLQTDGKTEIDFTVWMPATNALKLENKFGDVFIEDFSSDVEILLSNGNLKAHDFDGKTNITLNFADATINEVKNGRFNCNYSEVYLKKAGMIQIVSKSSEFEINDCEQLNVDSRRDKFRIQRLGTLTAKGSFTNYRMSDVASFLNIKTDYGDIQVDRIASDFKSVYIETKSTDINLGFSEKSVFGFEITNTKSSTRFCSKIDVKKQEVLDEKEKKMKLTGTFGTNAKSTKLFINATSGEINIDSN